MIKIMVRTLLLLILSLHTTLGSAREHPPKSPLKILFVGYDPSRPAPEFTRSYPGMMTKEGFMAQYPVRMPAFKALLGEYFAEVKTIDCRDWKPADSEPFDVTIIDFRTSELEPAKREKQANGETKYTAARYLPDNFSRPVIFISSTASEMGERIGLKLDWLCLCLDADAHHLNTGHAIFKGPLEKVAPTIKVKTTPEGVFHYASGDTVPKEIPMWRVQNNGYLDAKDTRIGLVSRGGRFTESPDAEVISSGVCQKDVGAVALGRHGNFFLWGFGASPADMTDEAKKVFVNAVVYMKQFNNRIPIARKYNDRMCTTDDVKNIIANASKDKYEEYVQSITRFNDQNKAEKKRLDDKKAAGRALTASETESLMYIGNISPINSWEDYLKQTMGEFSGKFGTDAVAFKKYLTDNFGYLYCDPNAFYKYTVDEDAKAIGVSNHSIVFLDSCIQMLKRNDRTELAQRMLKKYTGESFATSKEWGTWFMRNKKKLFFTETGGYKFMVNTYSS